LTKILTEEISVSPKDFISYETLVQGLMLTKHFREAEKYLNEAFEVARKHGISKGRQKSLLKLKQTLYESFPADLLPRQDLLWE